MAVLETHWQFLVHILIICPYLDAHSLQMGISRDLLIIIWLVFTKVWIIIRLVFTKVWINWSSFLLNVCPSRVSLAFVLGSWFTVYCTCFHSVINEDMISPNGDRFCIWDYYNRTLIIFIQILLCYHIFLGKSFSSCSFCPFPDSLSLSSVPTINSRTLLVVFSVCVAQSIFCFRFW